MKRDSLKALIYLLLLMVVAPVGIKAYYERWWIRDPERICRLALMEMTKKHYGNAQTLWRRAVHLRPDWYVPYMGMTYYEAEARPGHALLRWLGNHLPEPLDYLPSHLLIGQETEAQAVAMSHLRQATRLEPEAESLWGIWIVDAKGAAFYEKALVSYLAKRYRDCAIELEKGIARYPRYQRAYGLLIKACGWQNQPERGVERLLDSDARAVGAIQYLQLDLRFLIHLRNQRPREWRLFFHNYELSGEGWHQQSPSTQVAALSTPVTVLAVRNGCLWSCEWGVQTKYNTCLWRLRKGQWTRYDLDYIPCNVAVGDYRTWVIVNFTRLGPCPVDSRLRFLSGSHFAAERSWRSVTPFGYSMLTLGKDLWLANTSGIMRENAGQWRLYPWPGVRVVSGTAEDTSNPTLGPLCRLSRRVHVVEDPGLRKDSVGEQVLSTDTFGRLWCDEQYFDGVKFRQPDSRLLAWRRRCIMDVSHRLWGADEGFWGRAKFGERRCYKPVELILIDQSKRMWLGTKRGLVMWDGRRLMFWDKDDGLAGSEVTSLALDGNTLWIGTDRGVSRTTIPD